MKTEEEQQAKPGFLGHKSVIAIGCGIVLALAILTFSNRATKPNRNNPYFNYGAGDNRNGVIQVIDNKRVEVPIVFDIDQKITEVTLEFSGEHQLLPGLSMTDKTARVIDGKVVSSMIIEFNKNPGLKAGTHFIKVVARDTSSGRIIREGEVQFTYNMHEVIGKCSC